MKVQEREGVDLNTIKPVLLIVFKLSLLTWLQFTSAISGLKSGDLRLAQQWRDESSILLLLIPVYYQNNSLFVLEKINGGITFFSHPATESQNYKTIENVVR